MLYPNSYVQFVRCIMEGYSFFTFWYYLWLFPDILYLNKQRIMAVEELNNTNSEKQQLLERIEQLEAEKQSYTGKGDKSEDQSN